MLTVALAALALAPLPEWQRPLRQRVLAALETHRLTPGRLAGETTYRPWRGPEVVAEPRGDAEAEAGELRTAAREQLRVLDVSLLQLASGRTSQAIAGYELAARTQPTAVVALTDLSAAYLARFETGRDPLDLLRSIEATDRGLALQGDNSVLLFNRAQALTTLGTRLLASAAWHQALERQPPGWREEGRSRLRALSRPTADEEWSRALSTIDSAPPTRGQIAALTNRLPANARLYAEEILLPGWARALGRADEDQAERDLDLASAIGDSLARDRGEWLLADAVAAIRSTQRVGSAAQQRALIRGLDAFGRGVAQYNEQNLSSAEAPLAQALQDLGVAQNPLRFWASFYLSVAAYYADADRALTMFDALLAQVPQDRYLALTGRAQWMAGTADKVQGRIQSSVRRCEHAERALQRSGGDYGAAFVSVLLAESYALLGEHSSAWQARLRAFRTVPFAEGPRRNVAMWIEAKEGLFKQGSLVLAGPVVEEAVANARVWGRPLGLATALLERAAYLIEVGRRRAATADLRAAREAVAQMEDSPLKQQMSFLVLKTEGVCLLRSNPAQAAELLRQGLEGQVATGSSFEALTYTTALAEAQLANGDVRSATRTFEDAVAIFETIRSTVEDPASRMQAFRQAQPAFDALMKLQVSGADADRERAFALAERSRSRVLLDLRTSASRDPRPQRFVTLGELERTLPAGVALASYAMLDDRILVWVVADGRARLLTLPQSRASIVDAIETFRLEMRRGAGETALRDAAAPLFDALVRPLGLSVRGGETLIIVPDRWLAKLPFAALFDRQEKRYLIEQRAVTVVPSATLLMTADRRPPRLDRGPPAVLSVGVSAGGSFTGRALPSLPHAAEEARRVHELYGRGSFLQGPQASKGNFLRASVSNHVVHFAGHAVVDLEAPSRSTLLFAGSRAGELEGLSLRELLAAGLEASDLVVLSACRAQDSLADDRESQLGLAGAFFAGGAAEVVASPWDVHDRLSVPVMLAFHRQYLKRRSAASAYRYAVLDLLRSESPEERSPAAWGGFTVIGGNLDQGGV